MIVPPKALAQIGRIFAPDDELTVAMDEKQIGFRGKRGVVYSRLIEGPYPNYEQVIPKDNDKRLRADKERLSAALRRMAVMASDQTHRVRLSLKEDALKLYVSTPDVGEGTEEMTVSYEGDPIDIGFSLASTRTVLDHRAVVVSGDDLLTGVRAVARTHAAPHVVTGRATSGATGFVFSGQGAQWAGMAAPHLEHSPGKRGEEISAVACSSQARSAGDSSGPISVATRAW